MANCFNHVGEPLGSIKVDNLLTSNTFMELGFGCRIMSLTLGREVKVTPPVGHKESLYTIKS
jgi:hypothetical protein